jgi:hypothetical protein
MTTIGMKAIAILTALHLLTIASAHAGLCMKKNGTLVVRDACSRKETAVTPTMLGLDAGGTEGVAGPKGDRGPKGDPGEPGPKGEPGDPALPSGYFATQSAVAYIGDATSGAGVEVTHLNLPAGRHLVTAKVDAVNFGLPTFVRCFLDVGDARVLMATTFIGGVAGDGMGAVETLSLLAPIDAGNGATVSVRCRPDASTGNPDSSYIESGILVAMPTYAFVQQ